MKTDTNKEELYEVLLSSLQSRTNDPSEIATALARALAISLQATQSYTGDKEGVKETARKTFAQILDML